MTTSTLARSAKQTLAAFAVLGLLVPIDALAQVQVTVGLPLVRFETAPPLVVVMPGIQVVENYDEEIYVVGGWYWMRRDNVWYRTHNHRGGWALVERGSVPTRIVTLQPGKYRSYKAVKNEHGTRVVKAKSRGRGHKGKR